MPDDTNAAIQALIQQVTKLTATVDAQAKRLDELRDFNGRVLDEKKDLERIITNPNENKDTIVQKLEAAERKRKLESAGFKVDDKGRATFGDQDFYVIRRSEARDPIKYREAKALAAEAGIPLRVDDDIPRNDQTYRNTTKADVAQTKTFEIDDTHEGVRWVRADMHTGNGMVRRSELARQAGLTIKTWRTPDDLPQHVQTKFALMEKAANEADS